MKVRLRDLKPNPLRDFNVDPMNQGVIDTLKESIKQDGYWGGAVVTKKDGQLYTVAGHHRTAAAIAAGVEEADLYVVNDMPGDQMIRIYARENSTQRGNNATAAAGSVASALKFLAKQAFGNSPENPGELKGYGTGNGIGTTQILAFLGENVITRSLVEQQLANIKASGDYARILEEVQAEIEEEVGETLGELEEKIASAEKPADRKAAEKKVKSLTEKQDKLVSLIEENGNKTFDLEGVSEHLKVTNHIAAFRELCTQPNVQKHLPLSQQAKFAKSLVDLAAKMSKDTGKTVEVTARFISENFRAQLLQAQGAQRTASKKDAEALRVDSWSDRMTEAQKFAAADLRGFRANFAKVLELEKSRPKTVAVQFTAGLRSEVKAVRAILERAEKVGL